MFATFALCPKFSEYKANPYRNKMQGIQYSDHFGQHRNFKSFFFPIADFLQTGLYTHYTFCIFKLVN